MSFSTRWGGFLVRDDEKLHATTHGVDNLVDTERGDHQHHIAIDDLLPVVKNKIRRGVEHRPVCRTENLYQREVAIVECRLFLH